MKMLGKRLMLLAVAAVVGLSTTYVFGEDKNEAEKGEKKIEFNQLPAAAQAKLKELAAGAVFDEVSQEQEENGVEYEAAWKTGSRVHEAKVTANGDVMATSADVLENEVPAAVVQAAKQKAPQGSKLAFEQKNMIMYRVQAVDKDGKESKMMFMANGHEKEFGKHEGGQKHGMCEKCKCDPCKCAPCQCEKSDKACDKGMTCQPTKTEKSGK